MFQVRRVFLGDIAVSLLVTGNEVRLLFFNRKRFLSKTVMPLYRLSLLVAELLNSKTNVS